MESGSEIIENKAFIDIITPLDDSILEKDNTNIKDNKVDDWKDASGENKLISEAWIRSK